MACHYDDAMPQAANLCLRTAAVLLGIALLSCAYPMWVLSRTQAATGVVVGLSTHRSMPSGRPDSVGAVVQFATQSGQVLELTPEFKSWPAAFNVGDRLAVRYRPDHPEQAYLNSWKGLWLLTCTLLALSALTLCAGALPHLHARCMRWRAKRFRRQGQALQAQVLRVAKDGDGPNDVAVWRIWARGTNPVTGKVQTFHSQSFWRDPSAHVPADRMVTVHVSRRAPSRYHMDVDFVPRR